MSTFRGFTVLILGLGHEGMRDSSFLSQVESISTVEVLEHQEEEQHTKEVTSLSACPYLSIFVTSSKDGTIKVWNFDNQLVSDIDFGGTVSCVAFANNRGDLLVGVQIEVSIIRAEDYLPDHYRKKATKCPYWDHKERPIQFDPHLEFWSVFWLVDN